MALGMIAKYAALLPGHDLPRQRRAQLLDHWYHADDNLYCARFGAVRRQGAKAHRPETAIAKDCEAIAEQHVVSHAVLSKIAEQGGPDAAYLQRLSGGVYGAWHRALRSFWATHERHPNTVDMTMGAAVYVGCEALAQVAAAGAVQYPERIIAGAIMTAPSVFALKKFINFLTVHFSPKVADYTAAASVANEPSLPALWHSAHARTDSWLAGCSTFLRTAQPLHRLGLRLAVFAPLWSYAYYGGMALAGAVAGRGLDMLEYMGTVQHALLVSVALSPIEYYIQNHMRIQNKLPASMARSLVWGFATSVLNV